MATRKKAAKGDLAATARRAAKAGAVDEAMKALAALKTGNDDDMAWVLENEAALKAMPKEIQTSNFFPRIVDVKWRVDVTISTSSLERVMRPSVMMQLTLTDGTVKTFEMAMDQLHKLRYSLAKVLRSMQEIERNPIMRLIDDSSGASSSSK